MLGEGFMLQDEIQKGAFISGASQPRVELLPLRGWLGCIIHIFIQQVYLASARILVFLRVTLCSLVLSSCTSSS